jgi:hypothetical protein
MSPVFKFVVIFLHLFCVEVGTFTVFRSYVVHLGVLQTVEACYIL